jgi:hypothetical protein
MSRRRFLATGCATACAGAGGLLAATSKTQAAEIAAAPNAGKVKVRVIYALHAVKQPGPDWPNVGFDFQPVMDRINAALTKGCPSFEFVTSTADGEEAARKIVEGDKGQDIDGYLVYQMNAWNRVVQSVVASGKPTLFADFQYGGSGGFLVYTAGFIRAKASNLGFVASSKMEDVIAAVRCFELVKKGGSVADFVAATATARKQRTAPAGDMKCKADKVAALSPKECLARMKESKILVFEEGWPAIHDAVRKEMGIEVVKCPFKELNAAWEAADKDESKVIAERWQKSAAKVAGVTPETLQQSAAMYLAMKEILKKHGANAITVNCLGGFYGNHIHAYPCLGFHELLNEGLIGACESDVRSSATMATLAAMTGGRTGFISDPVIDTASRQIIYAHCVAPNRAFGPKGEANPFEILTHSEDRQGASLRSMMPLGYMTTTVEFAPERKTILFHQGKAVANVDDDRACRTKLAAEPVGDIEKLFTEWDQWGWHRVTVYGDLKEPVFALADAMGWKVLQEA